MLELPPGDRTHCSHYSGEGSALSNPSWLMHLLHVFSPWIMGLPRKTSGRCRVRRSSSALPLCSAPLDCGLPEDMTRTMAPCVRTLHGWPWEFETCLLDTCMNYREGKFLPVTYVMVINHCQKHFFNCRTVVLGPWNLLSQPSISVNFITHSPASKVSGTLPPAKQIFRLNLGLLHSPALCYSGM